MSKVVHEFSNPENLAVEKLTIAIRNAGVLQEIKALDPYWVDKRPLTLYERPPTKASVIGAVDTWKNKTQAYLEDLKWLLSLEHHRFWSTILYHPQCMDWLVSFLQEANPPYLPPHSDNDVRRLYDTVRTLVLVVFSRLITNKESKNQWMSKEYMADIIYDNFIFTIPIIWDLCLVYGADNSQHLSRLITSVFKLQPKYEGDAAAALSFVNEAFKYIIMQVNPDYDSDGPPNLPESFKGFSEIRRPTTSKQTDKDKVTLEALQDLVLHLLDTAMTVRIFVEVYHGCVGVLRKTNFVMSIVQLYEYGIPQLYEKLEEIGEPETPTFSEIEGHIDSARAELIDVFREVLAVYKNAILSGEGSMSSHVEDFLSVMMDGLSEKLMIRDYHACYPVNEDLEMLRQAYPDIDSVKTDFILQAIYSNLDEPIPEITNNHSEPNGHLESIDNAEPTRDNDIPDDIKEESLISEVRDILPHLGDGFILKCLQHYGFNSERVINSILEDNLAEPLRALDQSLPIIPEDILDQKYLETGISRLNVFDGDQFDIMTRDDVDLSKIHIGKKHGKYKNMKDMLDDKTEVRKLADVYSKYNMVCDDAAMYSDEYDDTYDSDGVTPAGDVTDERRPFVTPRALMTHQREESSEDEPEVEAAEAPNRNKLDFCVNPEEIRARRQASYQARGRGRGGQKPAPAASRNVDVKGNPRGQGQEKEVLVNRERKEKNKSSRGNHSRRQGAQWKRSQGMMPS